MKRCHCPGHRLQLGLSLIELMIGLTLSLVLTTGIVQTFLASKATYKLQEANSRLQENGRAAIDFLTRDIRSAGFLGCAGAATKLTNTLNSQTSFAWNFSQPIQGFEATSKSAWTPGLDSLVLDALGDSDIITIRKTYNKPVKVLQHASTSPPGSANLLVSSGSPLRQFDIVLVSDCVDSAIFQITGVSAVTGGDSIAHVSGSGTPGNATSTLGKTYAIVSEINSLETLTYYVRTTGAASGRSALWRQVNANAAQEFIEGVDAMQIRYGVDTDTGDSNRIPNMYVTADQIGDWATVTSVRIDLLLASIDDNVLDRSEPVTFVNGTTYGSDDRRLRRSFTTIVNLRNRSK